MSLYKQICTTVPVQRSPSASLCLHTANVPRAAHLNCQLCDPRSSDKLQKRAPLNVLFLGHTGSMSERRDVQSILHPYTTSWLLGHSAEPASCKHVFISGNEHTEMRPFIAGVHESTTGKKRESQ